MRTKVTNVLDAALRSCPEPQLGDEEGKESPKETRRQNPCTGAMPCQDICFPASVPFCSSNLKMQQRCTENWGTGGAQRPCIPQGTINHRRKAAKSPWSFPNVLIDGIRELLLGIKAKLQLPEASFCSSSCKYFLWEGGSQSPESH